MNDTTISTLFSGDVCADDSRLHLPSRLRRIRGMWIAPLVKAAEYTKQSLATNISKYLFKYLY